MKIIDIYKYLVFGTEEYQRQTKHFSKLNNKQMALKKKLRTHKEAKLSGEDENEYQSNLTLLRTLKRNILQVSILLLFEILTKNLELNKFSFILINPSRLQISFQSNLYTHISGF